MPSLVSVDISDVNSPESQPWLVHGTRQSPREMADEMGYGPFVASSRNGRELHGYMHSALRSDLSGR